MTNSFSISVRLQRTKRESAHISVPLTPDLMRSSGASSAKIDVEKLMQAAVELGQQPDITWALEEQVIAPHPVQTPPDQTE